MTELFKSLVPYCPRVHFSILWEADEVEGTDDFMDYYAAIRAIAIVNGELLEGESEFLGGIPIADGEEPTDEDLVLSGQLEELCTEALEKLKMGMAEGLPIEREIRSALEKLSELSKLSGMDAGASAVSH